jgi:hypothetical protein
MAEVKHWMFNDILNKNVHLKSLSILRCTEKPNVA